MKAVAYAQLQLVLCCGGVAFGVVSGLLSAKAWECKAYFIILSERLFLEQIDIVR